MTFYTSAPPLRTSIFRLASLTILLALRWSSTPTFSFVISNHPSTQHVSFIRSSSSSQPLTTKSLYDKPCYQSSRIKLRNMKDDEIAELEEKLKQLKEQKEEEALKEEQQALDDINNSDNNVLDQVPLNEMLSESWKEKEMEGNSSGSIISSLVTGLALVVAFVLFSQIPVGQEGYEKYTTAKPSTTIDLGDKNPISRIEIN